MKSLHPHLTPRHLPKLKEEIGGDCHPYKWSSALPQCRAGRGAGHRLLVPRRGPPGRWGRGTQHPTPTRHDAPSPGDAAIVRIRGDLASSVSSLQKASGDKLLLVARPHPGTARGSRLLPGKEAYSQVQASGAFVCGWSRHGKPHSSSTGPWVTGDRRERRGTGALLVALHGGASCRMPVPASGGPAGVANHPGSSRRGAFPSLRIPSVSPGPGRVLPWRLGQPVPPPWFGPHDACSLS